jgi:hypothetical protein
MIVLIICLTLSSVVAPARADDKCEAKVNACLDSLNATRVELRDLKLQGEKKDDLNLNLTRQRDDAFEKAKDAAAPSFIPTEVWVIGAFIAGAVFSAKVLR